MFVSTFVLQPAGSKPRTKAGKLETQAWKKRWPCLTLHWLLAFLDGGGGGQDPIFSKAKGSRAPSIKRFRFAYMGSAAAAC